MKIIKERLPELLNHGFVLITEEYLKDECADEDDDLYIYKGSYLYCLGHSRRGQFYYILASELSIDILATKPDGSGGPVSLDDIFIKLFKANLIEI